LKVHPYFQLVVSAKSCLLVWNCGLLIYKLLILLLTFYQNMKKKNQNMESDTSKSILCRDSSRYFFAGVLDATEEHFGKISHDGLTLRFW